MISTIIMAAVLVFIVLVIMGSIALMVRINERREVTLQMSKEKTERQKQENEYQLAQQKMMLEEKKVEIMQELVQQAIEKGDMSVIEARRMLGQ